MTHPITKEMKQKASKRANELWSKTKEQKKRFRKGFLAEEFILGITSEASRFAFDNGSFDFTLYNERYDTKSSVGNDGWCWVADRCRNKEFDFFVFVKVASDECSAMVMGRIRKELFYLYARVAEPRSNGDPGHEIQIKHLIPFNERKENKIMDDNNWMFFRADTLKRELPNMDISDIKKWHLGSHKGASVRYYSEDIISHLNVHSPSDLQKFKDLMRSNLMQISKKKRHGFESSEALAERLEISTSNTRTLARHGKLPFTSARGPGADKDFNVYDPKEILRVIREENNKRYPIFVPTKVSTLPSQAPAAKETEMDLLREQNSLLRKMLAQNNISIPV